MKNLIAKVTMPIIFMAASGCRYQNYQTSYPQQRPSVVQRHPEPEQKWIIEDPCKNPKIIFRGADPRFRNFKNNDFGVWSFNTQTHTPNFNDARWNYKRGEILCSGAKFTSDRKLVGSTMNYVVISPSHKIVSWLSKVITRDAPYHFQPLSVSEMLNKVGAGVYTIGYGVDGKGCCMMKVRVSE